MIKLSNTISEILEYNGFSYNEVEEQDGEYYIELNNGTPEGEDWWVTVWFDGTDKSFVDAVEEITTNFDIDEEVEIYIPSRGQNGVPSSISALVHDAEWRFWLLFEDGNVDWNISNEDKEYVKQEAIKYCLSNGYSYNGKYFEQR